MLPFSKKAQRKSTSKSTDGLGTYYNICISQGSVVCVATTLRQSGQNYRCCRQVS